MSTVIEGQGADYTTDTTDTTTTPANTAVGSTTAEPYTTRFGKIVIRASSEEELNDFLAWLSNMAGKPVDELDMQDLLQNVKVSEFDGNFRGIDPSTGESFSSFSLGSSSWATIDTFNDTHFFGDRIPEFPAGSGAFFGSILNPANPGIELNAGLAGFAATAQLVYQSNYPDSARLPTIDTSTLDPAVLELLQKMFGANTTFDQGHLNVLKMMNMVTGTVNQPIGEWRLTADTGAPLLQAYKDNPQAFIPSVMLLELEQVDFTKAKGVPLYFDETGNFINGNGPENVEKIARELIGEMSPANTALPAGTVLGERVANTLNALFGLPMTNTSFTAEQVNTAIAMGLMTYDATTSTVSLTDIGRGYLLAKNPEGMDPATPTPPGPPTREQNLQSIWNDWNFLVNNNGVKFMDFVEKYFGPVKPTNSNFGLQGLHILANMDQHGGTNSKFWDESGLGHLTTQQRQELIDTAKRIINNPLHMEVWNRMNSLRGGNDVAGAVHIDQIRDWLNETKDTWKPQLEQYKSRYNDPGITVPGNGNDFWLPSSIGPSQFTNAEWENINKICESLFGKKFDQMSQDERRKALFVLSTGPNPLVSLVKDKKQIQAGRGGPQTQTILNVGITNHGLNYLNSLNQA